MVILEIGLHFWLCDHNLRNMATVMRKWESTMTAGSSYKLLRKWCYKQEVLVTASGVWITYNTVTTVGLVEEFGVWFFFTTQAIYVHKTELVTQRAWVRGRKKITLTDFLVDESDTVRGVAIFNMNLIDGLTFLLTSYPQF